MADTNETTAVAVRDETAIVTASEDLETLRAAVGPELNNSQLKLTLLYARKVGADVFARDIYPIITEGRLTFITSIDFARSRAQASGEYRGQGRPVYEEGCTCQGEEIRLERNHPVWAEVPVYREGFLEPMIQRAYFHEYAPLEHAKQGDGWVIKYTWRKMPHVMVAKVSEMLALRKSFPRDLQQLYVQEEMEQAGAIDVTPRLAAGDIPAEPGLPEGLTFVGATFAAVDGVRMVKPPDWVKGLPTPTEKVEIKFKIGSRRHTALIFGPLARQVADAGVADEQRVAMDGQLREIEWQAGKPKKKELHNVTRVALMVGNEWQEVGAAPEMTMTEGAIADGQLEEAAAAVFTELVDPIPGGSTPAGPPTATTEAATVAPASAPTDDMDALLSGAALPSESVAGEVLEDVSKAMALPVWNNDAGAPLDAQADVIELEQQHTGKGKPFLHAWLRQHDAGVRYEAVMSEEEAQAQGVYGFGDGQVVRAVGTWATAGDRTVVMLTALVAVTA